MNNLFIRTTVIAYLLAIGLCTSVCGQESGKDNFLTISRFFCICDKDRANGVKICTEEQTVQNHDGKDVFCTKRKVEYQITETSSKLVIKRKVLSSETTTLCDDKEQQIRIFPNVTSHMLSSVLKPKKMKTQEISIREMPWSVSRSADGRTVTFDKFSCVRVKPQTLFGETTTYDGMTEQVQYKSADSYCLDTIEKIVSEKDISTIQKNGAKHKITVVETIVVL